MAVVTRGLGLPEEGSIVAFGLGRSALVGADVLIPAITVAGTAIVPGAAAIVPSLRDGSPWGSVPIVPVYSTTGAAGAQQSTVVPMPVSTSGLPEPATAAVGGATTAVLAAAAGRSQVAAARHGTRRQRLPFDSQVATATPTSEVGT